MRSFDLHLTRISIAILLSLLILPRHALAEPVGKTASWTANPGNIVQGKTSEVILSAPGATCGTTSGQLNDTSLDSKTTLPKIHVQAGFDVSVSTISHSGTCELTVSLIVGSDAKTGTLRLTITGAGNSSGSQDLGYGTITVTSSQAGPIPDGLAPQVDASLDVLGYQSVYDNFGRRVADNYYAVKVTIGNNTGFPLQLSEVGFKINGTDSPTPTAEPSIVQGTLIYGQDYSARNIIYRGMVWAALLGAAASPYFHSANAKANYAVGLALFSGAAVNGYLQQFPDNTVKQLARLNASGMMTDQNVIPNNSQVPFIAFVSRDSVCVPGSKNIALCGTSHHYKRNTFYDPTQVKYTLHEVTIVGKLLPNFLPRIKVTVAQVGTPPTTGTADKAAVEGVATTVSLQSTGLTGATLNSTFTGVMATGTVTDSSFPISVLAMTKSASPLSIVLKRKDGSLVTFPVTIQQPVPVVTMPIGMTTLPVKTATVISIGWQSTGPDLSSATITMAAADGTINKLVATPANTPISATITPAKAGPLPIQLTVTVNGTVLSDLSGLTVTAK
jgi:hypothetical protein